MIIIIIIIIQIELVKMLLLLLLPLLLLTAVDWFDHLNWPVTIAPPENGAGDVRFMSE
jgi:hypothetical protein